MAIEFKLSKREQHWQQIAHEVATRHLAPRATEVDRSARFPRENFSELGKSALMGLLVPEEYGGGGGDILTSVVVTEALAEACASTAMCYHMHNSAVVPLVILARGEQIDKFISPIVAGKNLLSYAVSEPGSGSRWWHMDTYAKNVGTAYTLTGIKSFVTSAGEADGYLVLARATPSAKPDTLSVFIVERDTPGFYSTGSWDGLGMRGNCSAPMRLDNCAVDKLHLLGEEGLGFVTMFQYGIPAFLVGMAAVYLGIAQVAFDYAVSHVTKRIHSDTGLPLSSTETVQRYICEMKFIIDQTRLIVYRTAALIADTLRGTSFDEFTAVSQTTDWLLAVGEAKVIACETAIKVTNTAVQVCGGTGYSRKEPLERFLRDARAGSIMGPNDDAVKLLVGQRLLGQPFPWEH
jgi:isovaleryl-CoA dehydrogenase